MALPLLEAGVWRPCWSSGCGEIPSHSRSQNEERQGPSTTRNLPGEKELMETFPLNDQKRQTKYGQSNRLSLPPPQERNKGMESPYLLPPEEQGRLDLLRIQEKGGTFPPISQEEERMDNQLVTEQRQTQSQHTRHRMQWHVAVFRLLCGFHEAV